MRSPRVPSIAGPASLALAVLGLLLGGPEPPFGSDQEPGPPRQEKVKIMLLGTAHLTSVSADVLSEKRQRELDAVAERIAEWGPDRFFVECSLDEQPALDSVYRAYQSGTYELADPQGPSGRGEIHQIGFRTAARTSGLGGVSCADAETHVPYQRARSVAKEHNPEVLKDYRQYADTSYARDSLLARHTIREALRALNNDQMLWENYKSYLYYYARMGTFEESGARIRRESDLEGAVFAVPFDVAERHMEELREAIESVGGKMVEKAGPEIDYVVLRNHPETESEAATGPDTISVAELGDLIGSTSTTWVGFPSHHLGADVLAQRYKRDARIYANVWNALREGEDRVVVMFGQAHIWNLRKLFRDNPDFEVVPVGKVL